MLQAETGFSAATKDVSDEFVVALPVSGLRLSQDAEWCVIRDEKGWREIRFHDYGELYEVPGLYERVFYRILKCNSPAIVRSLLEEELSRTGAEPQELRVLDLGAGNGMVGEELAGMGVDKVVGVDIIEAAKNATDRDRPGIYQDYLVTDMTNLADEHWQRLAGYEFNCLTCVAALGFGDIPTKAFVEAYNLIARGGWIAFNIKESFLNGSDSSGFARLIKTMIADRSLLVRARSRYRHRLATNGDPLYYVAMAAVKRSDVTDVLPS